MIPNRAVVIGTGLTGRSILNYLHERCDLYVTDTRLDEDPAIRDRQRKLLAEYPSAQFLELSSVVELLSPDYTVYLSPGISLRDPVLDIVSSSGAQLSSDVELFLRNINVPVLGITGTNGKSTVTSLTGKLLEDRGFQVAGNIGLPVLDAINQDAKGFVLELSSFQLERMPSPGLRAATILNITEDHLDHHGSFDNYCSAKHRIYEHCELAVFDAKQPITAPQFYDDAIMVNASKQWGVHEDFVTIAGRDIAVEDVALQGRMNHLNVVIAAALASTCEPDIDVIIDGIKNFEGLPHRTQLVTEIDQVRYINDSKATNTGATAAALNSVAEDSKNVVLLAGGDAKGATFQDLIRPIETHVKELVLFGRDADLIGNAVGSHASVHYTSTLSQAVQLARTLASAGDVVMLSPACASFDMFANYVDRGLRFEEVVMEMAS